jgi:hypothetical protein
MFYDLVGKISVGIILSCFFLIVLSLSLGIILIKKNKLFLPRILLFTLDTFYLHSKRIARIFGLGDKIVDQIGVEVRNHLNQDKFSEVEPKDRILVVPQCLRHSKCPARLDSSIGITCKGCGKCVINDLKKEAENLGYRFYVVPGGRFVERIVKAVKPEAAIGVACFKDLNIAMHEISKAKCIVQGVPLIKEGCVETQIDLNRLIGVMRLGIGKIQIFEDVKC